MSRLTFEQLLPEDLPEPFESDDWKGDVWRDALADLKTEHTYPVTLSEGALMKRQAE